MAGFNSKYQMLNTLYCLKSLIIMHSQLGFYFLYDFNYYRDNNKQSGAAKSKACSAGDVLEDYWKYGNER